MYREDYTVSYRGVVGTVETHCVRRRGQTVSYSSIVGTVGTLSYSGVSGMRTHRLLGESSTDFLQDERLDLTPEAGETPHMKIQSSANMLRPGIRGITGRICFYPPHLQSTRSFLALPM